MGVRQRLTVQITAAEPPRYFRDEMRQGAFRSLCHEHFFEAREAGQATLMRDRFAFESPGGIVGRCFNRLYLTAYMTRFLRVRNQALKQAAEAAGGGNG